MPGKALPSAEDLRQLLTYDPETGRLFWKERPRGPVKWNTRYAGVEAFTARSSSGHLVGSIFDKRYLAHRVAWVLHYGFWPNGVIDHINRDPSDNRIVNLRDVSQQKNMQNASRSKRNTSGTTGVCWDENKQVWLVRVGTEYVGRFRCKTAAVTARQQAERNLGYHPNHGR